MKKLMIYKKEENKSNLESIQKKINELEVLKKSISEETTKENMKKYYRILKKILQDFIMK